jgi:RNA recognition motif-containing protein
MAASSCISYAVASGSFTAASGRAEPKLVTRVNVESTPISVVAISSLSLSYLSSSSRRPMKSTSISVYASEVEQAEAETEPLSLNAIDSPNSLEGSKLYVGNLPWTCDSQQLAEVFEDCGNVEIVEVLSFVRNFTCFLSFSCSFTRVLLAIQCEDIKIISVLLKVVTRSMPAPTFYGWIVYIVTMLLSIFSFQVQTRFCKNIHLVSVMLYSAFPSMEIICFLGHLSMHYNGFALSDLFYQ